MSSELLYTSAPKGLRQGTRGFCTVISSAGMPSNLASKLESLSGYRQMYAPESADAAKNPVAFSHLTFSLGGQTTSVLSRVAAYGTDYSGRTNKLAHHVVPDRTEQTPSGPAWALQQPGVMRAKWNGECQTTATGPTIPHGQLTPALCQTWQTLTGDAGWAGVLAETWTQRQSKPVWIVFPVEQQASLLQLFVEASALLPQNQRWNATFSTYATQLPPDINCSVRCVVDGTQDARMASARGTVIKLGQTNPSPASSKWVEIARGKQVEAVPTPATTNPVPPTPTPSSPASAGASAPSEPTLAPAIPATPDTHHAAAPPDIQSPPNAAPAIPMPVHDASSTTPDLPLQLQPTLGTNPSHQNLTSPTGPSLPPFAGDNDYEVIPEKKFFKSHSTLLATTGGVAVVLAAFLLTTAYYFWQPTQKSAQKQTKPDLLKGEASSQGNQNNAAQKTRESVDPPLNIQEPTKPADKNQRDLPQLTARRINPQNSGDDEGSIVTYKLIRQGSYLPEMKLTLKSENTDRVKPINPEVRFEAEQEQTTAKFEIIDQPGFHPTEVEIQFASETQKPRSFQKLAIVEILDRRDFNEALKNLSPKDIFRHLNGDRIEVREGKHWEFELTENVAQKLGLQISNLDLKLNPNPNTRAKLSKKTDANNTYIESKKQQEVVQVSGSKLHALPTTQFRFANSYLSFDVVVTLSREGYENQERQINCQISDTTPEKVSLEWNGAEQIRPELIANGQKTLYNFERQTGYHPWSKRKSLPAIKLTTNKVPHDPAAEWNLKVKNSNELSFSPSTIKFHNTARLKGVVSDKFQIIEVEASSGSDASGKTPQATLAFRNPQLTGKKAPPENGWSAKLPSHQWYKRPRITNIKSIEADIEFTDNIDISDFRRLGLIVEVHQKKGKTLTLKSKNDIKKPEVFIYKTSGLQSGFPNISLQAESNNLKITLTYDKNKTDFLKAWHDIISNLRDQLKTFSDDNGEIPPNIKDAHEKLRQVISSASEKLEKRDGKLSTTLEEVLQTFETDKVRKDAGITWETKKPQEPPKNAKEQKQKDYEQKQKDYEQKKQRYEQHVTLDDFLNEFRQKIKSAQKVTKETEEKTRDFGQVLKVKYLDVVLLDAELKHHFEFR